MTTHGRGLDLVGYYSYLLKDSFNLRHIGPFVIRASGCGNTNGLSTPFVTVSAVEKPKAL